MRSLVFHNAMPSPMLTRLEIENFRSFKQLTVDPLKRINLICGKNNSGKTTLLEALFALPRPGNGSKMLDMPEPFRVSSANVRENEDWLVYGKDESAVIKITGWGWPNALPIGVEYYQDAQKAEVRTSSINRSSVMLAGAPCRPWLISRGNGRWPPDTDTAQKGLKVAIFSTDFAHSDKAARDFSRIILKRKKGQVIEWMSQVEPRLTAIESLQIDNHPPRLYADVGLSEMIPVAYLGQGVGRLISIYAEIFAEDANVLLIDEIENGLHHSVMQTVWKGLAVAAREGGVQIFATTHSWECILAANGSIPSDDDFQVIRLDRIGDTIKPTIMDRETITTAEDLGWEMR